jgi:hypothetical protein
MSTAAEGFNNNYPTVLIISDAGMLAEKLVGKLLKENINIVVYTSESEFVA